MEVNEDEVATGESDEVRPEDGEVIVRIGKAHEVEHPGTWLRGVGWANQGGADVPKAIAGGEGNRFC
eukprot:CAMPEP_0172629510 /NCGR_PEP_ID=MMETSP1068-20121228/168219_1 /TAXON_ID=35684 /ORGANISM="Pseudopedinella elastica, Strain CCMP716" /LENGTH=66 /DNA_ID=CAMNT_0013440067 /DNA_START=604 /DNA_END=804 /DNA_ORIENTATION=-